MNIGINKWDVKKMVKTEGLVGLNKAIKIDNTVVRINNKEVSKWGKNKIGVVGKVKGRYGEVGGLT